MQIIEKTLKINPSIKQQLKTTKRRLRWRPKGARASHPPPWIFVVFNVCLIFGMISGDFSRIFIDFLMFSYDFPMNGQN